MADRVSPWHDVEEVDVHDGWSSVGEEVQRVYGRGRRALAVASEKLTVEDLHEWRKQVSVRTVSLGRRIFRRAPNDFMERLHAYWKAWS